MSEGEDFSTFMVDKNAQGRFARCKLNANLHRDPQCNTEYLPCPADLADVAYQAGYKWGRKDTPPARQVDKHGNPRWRTYWRIFRDGRWAEIATHPAVRGTLNERHTHTHTHTHKHAQTATLYTEANIKDRVFVSIRKKKCRANKEYEARRKKSRKDEGEVDDAAEPQAKKQKAMTAAQRKEEVKRLAALAAEALAKKEKLAEFFAMFDPKKEEVKRKYEGAGIGTTPARATPLRPSVVRTVPHRPERTPSTRTYPHGTFVPTWIRSYYTGMSVP